MRFLLLTHAPSGFDADTVPGWPAADLVNMVGYMRSLDASLRESGELLDDNGFGGPEYAKMVRTEDGRGPAVTDRLRPDMRDFLVGYWLLDVASEERALEIAALVSATPAPGGVPVDQPVEVHPVLPPPSG